MKKHINVEWESNVPEYAIHTNDKVCGFFGTFRFLSNFFPARVHFDGIYYPSVEHAYQAAKYDQMDRAQFTSCTAGQAKRLGKKAPNLDVKKWDRRKYELMTGLVLNKFLDNFDLKDMLLATDNAYLEETNSWGDTYWGKDEDGQGENKLGQILMGVRETIRNNNL